MRDVSHLNCVHICEFQRAKDHEARRPRSVVRLARIALRCIARVAAGDEHSCACTEQLERDSEADTDASSGDKGHHAMHGCRLLPFGQIDGGARWAELVVEAVALVVGTLAASAEESQ